MSDPLFSILTPTHKPIYLDDCYDSLLLQKEESWEWIIHLNNGAHPGQVSDRIKGDPRVRLNVSGSRHSRVGSHRRNVAAEAKGELLVELSHSDKLMVDALKELKHHSAVWQGGFYYSDFVRFLGADNIKADEDHGWKSYSFEDDTDFLNCTAAFDPHPVMLTTPEYSPSGLRAWHRDCYSEIGGHDATITASPDMDILCRTYLTGRPFVRIPKCLYIKREHAHTYKNDATYVKSIHQNAFDIRHKSLHKLIENWAARSGKPKGTVSRSPMEGFKHLDPRLLPYWELEENSLSVIRAVDGLQHVKRRDFVDVMNELHRALIPGGFLLGVFPDSNGNAWHAEPDAVNPLREASFLPFTDKRTAALVPNSKAKFQVVDITTEAPSDWHYSYNLLYTSFTLCAIKGQRVAGPRLI